MTGKKAALFNTHVNSPSAIINFNNIAIFFIVLSLLSSFVIPVLHR
ncbi:hypothetical protein BC2230_30072 [Burkholderia cepacia]